MSADNSNDNKDLFNASTWGGKIYNGEWKEARGGVLETADICTGEVLGSVGLATAEDINEAAATAKAAQVAWANTPAPERGDVLRRFAQLCMDNLPAIAEWIVRESGSIRGKSEWEVATTSREVLEAAGLSTQPPGLVLASEDPARTSVARRIPVGVVGVITPWNSPFLLAARAFGPALVSGNAVILKPDHQTPVTGGVLPALLLEAAGLPKGLIQVMPGGADAGQALVEDPNVGVISFTGSTATGKAVGAAAGAALKRVVLELGGNNPYIVCDDAPLEQATSCGAWGSFFHQGQICLTSGRHIVQESVADDYIAQLKERAERLPVGDPFTTEVAIGPMINEKQAANVDRIVAESLEMGATLVCGGKRDGLFYQPTVVSGVTPDMPLFKEEIFGPVAAITTFKDDEEAIALANDTAYGLVGAIQTPDLGRANAIANRLHAGIVHINDQTVVHEVYGPIGGVGMSGNGYNYGNVTNLDQFTEWQWVTSRADAAQYPF